MLDFSPGQWAALALFTPLLAAAVLALVWPLRRLGGPAAGLSLVAATVNLAAAGVLLTGALAGLDPVRITLPWLIHGHGGGGVIELGVHLDGISLSMLAVVAVVAWCVQVFSLGYLADEPRPAFGRYYTWQSLFLFAMNSLVLAPNLLQLFLGWELVGLCSYLLIGFWYTKPSAARAALKAFWVTKFADMGLLMGLIVLFAQTGGFEWTATPAGATAITLLLFVAVMGKSAQFPLHIWLPDAMEGPTPVSALLHAATMVAAGVFLVVRAQPLFAQAPLTGEIMTGIGAFTALFAAAVAVVQTDIKKVLAYSTCSQLGYMIAALGSGALLAGYLHLTTHAFFKALLFLAAGGLIHAVHSNQLADMGGLLKKLPVTGWTFILAALALAGVPGLSGFFSKDLILEALAAEGAWLPLAALLAGAFLTAFYMGKVVFQALLGPPGPATAHAHEGGFSLKLPLLVLAVPAVALGYFAGPLAGLYGQTYHFHLGPVGILGAGLGLAGIGLAWLRYGSRPRAEALIAPFAPLGRLARSGAVDRGLAAGYRRGLLALGAAIAWIDRYLIDGLMNLIGYLSLALGDRLRASQTGDVRDALYAVAAGLLLLGVFGALFVG